MPTFMRTINKEVLFYFIFGLTWSNCSFYFILYEMLSEKLTILLPVLKKQDIIFVSSKEYYILPTLCRAVVCQTLEKGGGFVYFQPLWISCVDLNMNTSHQNLLTENAQRHIKKEVECFRPNLVKPMLYSEKHI